MRRKPIPLAILAALMLMLAACSSGTSGSADSDSTESTASDSAEDSAGAEDATDDGEEEARSQERTLVVAASGTPSGFDGDIFGPNMQPVVVNLNEPLVDYGVAEAQEDGARQIDTATIEGRLATAWEESEDGLTWTLELRDDVVSHRGNSFTSADVVWSYEKSKAQERTGNFIANFANVDTVEAIDEYTVQFNLSAPSPAFLDALTLYVPGIYDSTAAMEHATDEDPYATEWLAQNDAYFGPYYVESNAVDQQTVFVAHADYYRGAPYFERIIWQAVPEAENRSTLISTGQADWMRDAPIDQVVALQDREGVRVQSVTSNEMARALMNPNFAPWDDVRVRQALNLAVDHQRLLDVVFQGYGEIARGPVPPVESCATDEFWSYDQDVERARELLAEAGYPDGVDAELLYSDVRAWEEALAIQIADSASDAGFNITLQRIPSDEMTSRAAISVRDLPFFTFYQNPILLDPGYTMYLDGASEGVSNRSDWNNEEYDALVIEANQTLDADARCDLLTQAQEIHMADAPWLYGVWQDTVKVMGDDIDGWVWHGDQHARWYDLERSS